MLFTFPSRYLFAIGLSGVFSLTRWSWQFQTGFLVPRHTQGTAKDNIAYVYRTVTSFGRLFQNHSTSKYFSISQPYNPGSAETKPVWAIPISLATTLGITFVFFSCGYLDVSVPHVCLPDYPEISTLRQMGCPIRVSADRFVFANPRSFSQLVTPFFASESQGILRTPLVTFFLNPRIDSSKFFYFFVVSL